MNYRKLGKSGLRVSEISLGSWLTYGSSVEKETAIRCIDKAYELGINFFDTANVYARGESEKVVGEALRKYPRESYVLATKVFFPMGDGPNDRGLSRKHIIEQCNASLKRLGVDYIDLYQCHRFDPETPLDETLQALDDLVTQGKVLYVGVSEWTAVQINDALHLADKNGYDRIISNQPVYNMFNRYIEESVLPLCEREGVGQIVFSPLAQGLLTGKYKPGQPVPQGSRAANPEQKMFIERYLTENNLQKAAQLEKIAAEAGMPLANLALAWILRQPGVSSAIIGASRPAQIEQNVKASGVKLTPDLLQAIDEVLES
ncbi:aldo/keto reductase family protein [Effusibacillus pohliae]|uniref:aldo/keto reductase family protein n=1 Tax=Effusibacillus pohliae TaxID=232270 RepID=UPI000369CC6A|nr:aldo/keto reductase family protein [Effusibacillus pohliae]